MERANFGKKTLIFFILRRSGFFFFCCVLFIALLFATNILPGILQSYLQLIDFVFVIVILGTLGITLGIGFLEYKNFTISIYDRNLKVTRGIIDRHEIGIPYKAIDRVDITRTLLSQIFGVSNIIIHVSSDENAVGTKDETVALSFIEKNLAEAIQKEILEHSQVEHIKDIDLPIKKG